MVALRMGKGTNYVCQKMKDYLSERGIQHQTTGGGSQPRHTRPEQGVGCKKPQLHNV